MLLPPGARRYFLPVVLGLAGLAGGMVVTGEMLVSPAATDLAACRLRPLATAGEFARSPAFSNDGKRIVFTAAINGRRQVFVGDLSSAIPAQITHSPTDCERPFWSPDNSRVFFFSAGGAGTDLYVIGAGGGPAEVVQPNAVAAAISRGNTLAFFRADPAANEGLSLWISDAGSQEPRRFTGRPFDSARYQSGYLAFSPDGQNLGVWVSGWDGNSEFWVISWPDGQPRKAFSLARRVYPFSWMPDNRRVVFGGAAPGSFEANLQMVDTRNGSIRPLTLFTRDAVEASVSPDGTRVAFAAAEDSFDVFRIPLDGTPLPAVYAAGRSEFDPVWSPAGDQLAYATDRTGTSEIWLRSARQDWDRPLVTAKEFGQEAEFSEPAFSPDGRRIAYGAAGGKGYSVYVSAAAGGKPERLTTDSADNRSPSWNSDGSWIAYLRNNGSSWSLVKAALDGNSPPTVLRDGCLPYHPQWNGRWIACVTADGLTLVSEDGRQSLPMSQNRWLVFGWSQDGAKLYGIEETAARRHLTVSLDVATRAETVLGELPLPAASQIRGFSLSPDGESFTTSASRPSGSIWMLEGFRQAGLFSWLH